MTLTSPKKSFYHCNHKCNCLSHIHEPAKGDKIASEQSPLNRFKKNCLLNGLAGWHPNGTCPGLSRLFCKRQGSNESVVSRPLPLPSSPRRSCGGGEKRATLALPVFPALSLSPSSAVREPRVPPPLVPPERDAPPARPTAEGVRLSRRRPPPSLLLGATGPARGEWIRLGFDRLLPHLVRKP